MKSRSLVLMLADVTRDEPPSVTWALWKRLIEERRAYAERHLTVIPAQVIPLVSGVKPDEP